MPVQSKSNPTGSWLTRLSYFLKAMYIFFPGIIFLLLGLFAFINLPQGKDIIYQSTDGKNSWLTGLYLVLATIFWVSTTWYTARLIAYDRNDLYEKAPWVLYHFPRLLGYCIFLVLWLSVFLIDDIKHKLSGWAWGVTVIDFVIYIFFYRFIDKALTGDLSVQIWKRLALIRNIVRGLIVASCILVIVEWQNKHVNVLLYTLPVFQLGFLFLVIVRHPLYKCNPTPKKEPNVKDSYFHRYLQWIFSTTNDKFELLFEKPVFIIYHVLAGIAFICYLLCINYLPFARELTSFPLVLLGFGILLGVINFLSLGSHRKNINFNFLLIAVIIIAGFKFDIHPVRLKDAADPDKKNYVNRPGFRSYLENWIRWHKTAIDTSKEYPVFFTLADGGASRSGYWAALVLGRLHEATRYDHHASSKSYFSDHLFCLSGASGGSVGNTSFLSAYLVQQQHPELRTDTLASRYLDNDFLSYSLARLLGPDLIKPVFGWIHGWGDRAAALEIAMDNPAEKNSPMGKVMSDDFAQFTPNDQNQFPAITINATRVNDGGPAIVSNINIHVDSSVIFGKRLDVLNMVPAGKMMRVSTAMALGARFPYMSPGGKLDESYFVDGGYFDNSGAGVIHEMLLELNRIAGDSTDPLSPVVKKFQYYVLHLSNTPYTIADSTFRIHPTLNDLATPLLTLAGSYNSQTSVNDARLINYLKEINKDRNSYMIMNLYQKGIAESIPMNWVISNRVRAKMLTRVTKKRSLEILAARMEQGETSNLFRQLPRDN